MAGLLLRDFLKWLNAETRKTQFSQLFSSLPQSVTRVEQTKIRICEKEVNDEEVQKQTCGFGTDSISSSGLIGLKKETEKNWFLLVKKSR